MEWTKACDLEAECKELINLFSSLSLYGEDNIHNRKLLTMYKNQMLYHLLHHHQQPSFCLDNAEGKHCQLAYHCLATRCYINPNTVSISAETTLTYHHFVQNGIISKDKDALPKGATFLAELENMLVGTVTFHAIHKFSTVEIYYITSQPQEVRSNNVMSGLITFS